MMNYQKLLKNYILMIIDIGFMIPLKIMDAIMNIYKKIIVVSSIMKILEEMD